jgi:lipoprotein-releasing system ATP-binding protein
MILKATNIYKSYGTLKVLNGVSIEAGQGEVISIVGSSGAGKSTLLHILGTLDKADKGELEINNQAVHKLKGASLDKFRNSSLGFIFQFHHLLPEFTAIENICIPAYIKGVSEKDARKKGMELLEFLGLAQRADHKPQELSGGEQQRVAVARALINKPAVIFADEPSGNLDSENARDLHGLFFSLREQFKQTFIIVTHNADLAAMADRKLTMKDGQIVT